MTLVRTLLIGVCLALAAPATAAARAVFTPSHLFVASLGDDVVIELDTAGVEVRRIGLGTLLDPRGIAFGPNGNLYVASSTRVHVFAPDGSLVASLGAGTSLTAARGLGFGTHGEIYVTSSDRVLVFDADGTFSHELGALTGLTVPAGLAVAPNGHIFVASSADNRVFEYDPSGIKVKELGNDNDLSIPIGLAFGPDGRLWVSSLFAGTVIALDTDGNKAGGSTTFANAALAFPTGLAFGPNGDLFVASLVGNGVREFSLGGNFLGSVPGATSTPFPEGVAFAPHRFTARVSGELSRPGVKSLKRNENLVLSITPGSRTLMLDLTDNPNSVDDLATVFGSKCYVLHGFEAFASFTATSRVYSGFGFVEPSQDDGVLSLPLRVTGSLTNGYAAKRFLPKKATGSLHLASADAVFSATLKTKKAVK